MTNKSVRGLLSAAFLCCGLSTTSTEATPILSDPTPSPSAPTIKVNPANGIALVSSDQWPNTGTEAGVIVAANRKSVGLDVIFTNIVRLDDQTGKPKPVGVHFECTSLVGDLSGPKGYVGNLITTAASEVANQSTKPSTEETTSKARTLVNTTLAANAALEFGRAVCAHALKQTEQPNNKDSEIPSRKPSTRYYEAVLPAPITRGKIWV